MQAPKTEEEFERLLREWQAGDRGSGARLIELTYADLRRLAHNVFRGEPSGHTLQPTAIANMACMKMLRCNPSRLNDRAHFFAIAAIQMKNILVDHLRSRPVDKRIGHRIPIEDLELPQSSGVVELLMLNEALHRLEGINPRATRIVEFRYIYGLSEKETAEALQISVTTLKRNWSFAKAFLADLLGGSDGRIAVTPTRSNSAAGPASTSNSGSNSGSTAYYANISDPSADAKYVAVPAEICLSPDDRPGRHRR